MSRKIVSFIVLLATAVSVQSQIVNSAELDAMLSGERNFNRIINTVNGYYNTKLGRLTAADSVESKQIKRQLKMWKRWEFINRGHLDENGNITNTTARNFAAMQELNQMQQNNPAQPESAYGTWAPIGATSYTRLPGGHNGGLGRVNCIAFHPTTANTIYIGTPAGGLWRSTNNGASWAPLTDHIPSIGVSGIVIHPTSTNTIYILTGDGDGNHRPCLGVMKSTDGGNNWSFTGNFPSAPAAGFRGYKLIMDPTNSNILFAATDIGIYKTIDGGTNWTQEQSGWFSDIEFKPGDHNTMYAARMLSATPFYRSTDNGGTWSTAGITGVPANATRIAIGVSANNSSYVYLLAGPATGVGTYVGVYRSFDSGLDFDLRNSAPNILGYPSNGMDDRHQTTYDLAIEVDPANVAEVITGGINVWRSTNFGVNLTHITEWFEPSAAAGKYVHADIHNLAYNPLNNRLYVCSDGGVSYSDDDGVTWTIIWNGLQLSQYYMMSGYDPDQNRLIGGLQDNGTMYKKSVSFNFDHVEGADGYHALIDYTDPNIIYFDENDNLNRSADGGTTVSGTGLSGDCWPAMAMHVTNHNIIFAGRCDGVYKRTFPGGAWANTGGRGENRMLTCPSNSQRVYSYGGGTLRRSDNEAGNWTPAGPPVNPPTAQNITDMAVSPVNSLDLYVCVGGYTAGQKVYRSVDGGATWSNISGTLPNAACGAIIVDNSLNVYVGTDIGVFFRNASSSTWLPFYNDLPKVPITDLYINTLSGTIAASTFGRGLWRSDLYSACVANLVLSGTQNGNLFYEASGTITSTHFIQGGTGTEVYYKANNYVQLNPGFEVIAGAKAKAFIGPCGNGIPVFGRLRQYGINSVDEFLKQPLTEVSNNGIIAGGLLQAKGSDGATEIKFVVEKDQYVQLFYQDLDHEILAFLVKQNLKKGVYSVKADHSKIMTGRKVVLKLISGDSEKLVLPE